MARPRFRRLAIATAKTAVAVVVLWAVGRHVLRTYGDLRAKSESLHFDPLWLAVSGILYLAGLLACAVFYERILRSSTAAIGFLPAWRAYIVSHLGKYVPGKAMVVVLRSSLVVPYGGRASTAAIATFYETLVMMCAGGLVAAIGFAGGSRSETIRLSLRGWAGRAPDLSNRRAYRVGPGPRVSDRCPTTGFQPSGGPRHASYSWSGPRCFPRLTGKLLCQGLFWSSGGWVLLGLSQIAVIRSFDPAGADSVAALGLAPVVIASVALATVAGFVVAVLPGRARRARGRADVGLAPGPGYGSCGRGGAFAAVGLGGRRARRRGSPFSLVRASLCRRGIEP